MKGIKVESLRRVERHIALRVGTVLAAGVLLAGVSTAKANSITLSENAYSYGYGGEFTAVTSPSYLSLYNSAAIMNGGFETFCVQTTVYFTPGSSYSYTLANQDSNGQALSLGAAYLYYEFGTGALSGYNYSSTGNPSRYTDAGALQAAIWYFQGKQYGGSGFPTSSTITSDPFYQDAISEFGTSTAALAANDGTWDVEILQLTDTYTDCAAQNQLVLTGPPPTVPETTSTLTLLGAALTTLGFAGRKLRSK